MTTGSPNAFLNEAETWPDGQAVMPVLFLGHGSPVYTLEDNSYTRAWRELAQQLPRPRAVLCVSAHWLTRGATLVTTMPRPRTIHDFGRLDDRLFEVQYPAPGSPELAAAVIQELADRHIAGDTQWGLDHGTWTVLRHMYPQADVPIIQFSIDYNQPARFHYELGARLAFLRRKGVLIVASGNIVHNLPRLDWGNAEAVYDWAAEFDQISARLIADGDHESLIDYETLGEAAKLSIPTPDHYYPLLYALGLQSKADRVSFPVTGLDHGSISMRSVLIDTA